MYNQFISCFIFVFVALGYGPLPTELRFVNCPVTSNTTLVLKNLGGIKAQYRHHDYTSYCQLNIISFNSKVKNTYLMALS